jgi:hypothetical protein
VCLFLILAQLLRLFQIQCFKVVAHITVACGAQITTLGQHNLVQTLDALKVQVCQGEEWAALFAQLAYCILKETRGTERALAPFVRQLKVLHR